MASRYSKIQSSIWDSEKFKAAKEFSRIVYVYFLTSPHGNSAGLYRLKEAYAVSDIGCSTARYRAALADLRHVGLIEYDDDIIFIRQFLRFNSYANSNHAKGSLTEIADLLLSPLYELFYNDIETFCDGYRDLFPEPKNRYRNGIETVSEQFRDGIEPPKPITNTKTNTKTNNQKERANALRFKKPTLEEVNAYCVERNNGIDARAFCDFYEAKGWKIGKESMKDWKACVRTWENRDKDIGKKHHDFEQRTYTDEEYDDLFDIK